MNSIIEVFRMTEVSCDVRIKIIKKLGQAINSEYAMNITDDLVDELVLVLEKEKQDEY